MEQLKSKEINPILLLPVVVLILLAALYFLWLRPKMVADDAVKNFNSPEAQAKRDPDRRQKSEGFRQKREEFLAKENHATRASSRRHGE